MDAQLNWGLLGTARINRAVMPGLKTSPRNRLSAVASRNFEKAFGYAQEWEISKFYGSYEELLDDPEIDVIYNSLPNHLHAEWTIRACQSGKHVLCEKPLCLSLEEADAIIRAAEDNRVQVAEAFMYRHHPQTDAVRQIAADGSLGRLRQIQGTFSFILGRSDDIRWFPEMGGGSLWDVGCYPLSYARMIAGEPPVEVYGMQIEAPSGIDTQFIGQMRYSGGLLAQISSAFILPPFTRIEIRGETASLEIPLPFKPGSGSQGYLTREGEIETITFPDGNIYLGEIESLADSILDGAPPKLSLTESRENIATILALLESAKTGHPVLL